MEKGGFRADIFVHENVKRVFQDQTEASGE